MNSVLLGVDGEGDVHRYVDSDDGADVVIVVKTDATVEEHDLGTGELGDWVEFVREQRGWDELRTTGVLNWFSGGRDRSLIGGDSQ